MPDAPIIEDTNSIAPRKTNVIATTPAPRLPISRMAIMVLGLCPLPLMYAYINKYIVLLPTPYYAFHIPFTPEYRGGGVTPNTCELAVLPYMLSLL